MLLPFKWFKKGFSKFLGVVWVHIIGMAGTMDKCLHAQLLTDILPLLCKKTIIWEFKEGRKKETLSIKR